MNRVPRSVITPNASRHRRVRETLTARSFRTSLLVAAGRAVLIVIYLAVSGRAGSPESSDRSSALTGSRIGAREGMDAAPRLLAVDSCVRAFRSHPPTAQSN